MFGKYCPILVLEQVSKVFSVAYSRDKRKLVCSKLTVRVYTSVCTQKLSCCSFMILAR